MSGCVDDSAAVRFSPHLSDACRPHLLMVFAAGLLYGVFLLVNGSRNRMGLALSCVLMGVSLIAALLCWRKNRRTVCEITQGACRVVSPGGEKTMKLCALDRVEVRSGIFPGSGRVRIYSHAAHRAWLSVRLSEKDSQALVDAAVQLGKETGRTLSGRHSTVAYALASEKTAAPVIVSLQFMLLAGGSMAMNAMAYAMLWAAVGNIVVTVLSSCRLSLIRYENGCRVSMGWLWYRSVFIPDGSMAGAAVRRGPAELLCGTGSVCLVTEGGSKIPCMRMLPEKEILPDVRRILDAQGKAFVSFCDEKTLSRQYALQFTAGMFSSVLTAIFAFMADDTALRFLTCMGFSFFTLSAIGSLAGMRCASRWGLKVSPSCVLSAGTAGCCCVALCVRRHKISGIQIHSPLLWRMNDLCRAGLLTGVGSSGVWSEGVAYDALKSFVCRFG